MMKTQSSILLTLTCLFSLFFVTPSMAQSWEQVQQSSDYLCGEGYGNSIDEADQQALSDLISKISLNVSAATEGKDRSVVRNGDVDETSQFSMTVQTWAQATLTNTERVILHNEPDAHVGRWIKKSELHRTLRRDPLPDSLAACRIVPAALGDTIGDYAALSLAVQASQM